MDLNQFSDWAYEKTGSRYVTIKIQRGQQPEVNVGEFFGSRYVCQVMVKDVRGIDLEAEMEKEDRETYERLSKKYGEKANYT